MAKVFVLDVAKCSGCYNCQLACKDEHAGNDWTPYAKPQPDTGQFWVKLTEHVCGTIPKLKIHYIAEMCNHCDNPACINMTGCGAIKKRDDGFVIIDPEKCKGCELCKSFCPKQIIEMDTQVNAKGYCPATITEQEKCIGCAKIGRAHV